MEKIYQIHKNCEIYKEIIINREIEVYRTENSIESGLNLPKEVRNGVLLRNVRVSKNTCESKYLIITISKKHYKWLNNVKNNIMENSSNVNEENFYTPFWTNNGKFYLKLFKYYNNTPILRFGCCNIKNEIIENDDFSSLGYVFKAHLTIGLEGVIRKKDKKTNESIYSFNITLKYCVFLEKLARPIEMFNPLLFDMNLSADSSSEESE